MKDQFKNLEIDINRLEQRFEMKVGEEVAFVNYVQRSDTIALVHTEVPVSLQGQGVATAIIEKVLRLVQKEGLQIFPPLCSAILIYVKRHPEWRPLFHISAIEGLEN